MFSYALPGAEALSSVSSTSAAPAAEEAAAEQLFSCQHGLAHVVGGADATAVSALCGLALAAPPMLATLTPAPSASMIGSSSGCSVAVIALLAARPQFLSAHASHADAPTVAALAEVGRRLREGEDIDATLADSLGFECRDTASVLGPVPCTAIAALMMRVRFEVEVACPLFRRTPCLGGEGLHTSLRLLELLSMSACFGGHRATRSGTCGGRAVRRALAVATHPCEGATRSGTCS